MTGANQEKIQNDVFESIDIRGPYGFREIHAFETSVGCACAVLHADDGICQCHRAKCT